MDTELLTKLLSRLAGTERVLPRFRTGVVTVANPLTVTLGGSTTTVAGAAALGSYTPTIGDVVICVTYASDLVVLGKRGAATVSNVGAFYAYRSAAVSLATASTVVFDAERYDTSGWYDTATGRYQPTIPCLARLSWMVYEGAAMTLDTFVVSYLRLAGALHTSGTPMNFRSGLSGSATMGTTNVLFNGTTDYADIRFDHTNGGTLALSVGAVPASTYFTGEVINS